MRPPDRDRVGRESPRGELVLVVLDDHRAAVLREREDRVVRGGQIRPGFVGADPQDQHVVAGKIAPAHLCRAEFLDVHPDLSQRRGSVVTRTHDVSHAEVGIGDDGERADLDPGVPEHHGPADVRVVDDVGFLDRFPLESVTESVQGCFGAFQTRPAGFAHDHAKDMPTLRNLA